MAIMQGIWLCVFAAVYGVCCQDYRSDIFSIMRGKYYHTNHSLSLKNVESELQCAYLCESQKCCLSALIRQEDDGYLCRTLDTFIFRSDLVDDAMGSYIYKTDPEGCCLNGNTKAVNMKRFKQNSSYKYQELVCVE
ncbi:hypothetical protein CAPTEDRAFT_212239 [Capitella teleta]|uniref:Apple domain-containing protein n=1 Tax=Capitella teleta TaxID=283909 RepID=R7VGW9_CAPTE|nr:hypothetical protein CAPTEDRAFT_212239 [Capitella teleta]|eukprot:ELU17854.1 hypothetical protein CAPTEDRAFT_212239 [Capitella teleta]